MKTKNTPKKTKMIKMKRKKKERVKTKETRK